MQHFADLDFNAIWQETMGWNNKDCGGRQFDDEVEKDFWIKLAPRYTAEYNLNNDTPLIAQKLASLLGKNKSVLEIGCGSGNFTMLMARYCRKISGVDFSAAMTEELRRRAALEGLKNIETTVSKWEDYAVTEKADYIVSVNSIYRIRDMRAALQKMQAAAREGVILVRTIQRPFLYPLYHKCGVFCGECLDYELLPLLLWRMGIRANVEFVEYSRRKTYASVEEIAREMNGDLGTDVAAKERERLLTELLNFADCEDGHYHVAMPRTTVFIYWKKENA